MKVKYFMLYTDDHMFYQCSMQVICCGSILADSWLEATPVSPKAKRTLACYDCETMYEYSLYPNLLEESGAALEQELL